MLQETPRESTLFHSLRVEFLLKTDGVYPKDTGVTLFILVNPGNPLRYNTPRSALPDFVLAHSRGLGRGPSHQSHVLGHKDMYGQAHVCSKGNQRSSIHRPGPCQPSFCGQVLACTESATSEYWTRSQYLSALLGRLGTVKFILDGIHHSHTTIAR